MTVFYLPAEAPAPAEAAPGPSGAGTATRACVRAEGSVRIGFTVSKALGGSVERNRMRRRTREAVRHHLRMLSGMGGAVDVVINPKKSLLGAEFPQISKEIERAFAVIRRACESGCAAGGSRRAVREARSR
jgi:ribonuclease P protein component